MFTNKWIWLGAAVVVVGVAFRMGVHKKIANAFTDIKERGEEKYENYQRGRREERRDYAAATENV